MIYDRDGRPVSEHATNAVRGASPMCDRRTRPAESTAMQYRISFVDYYYSLFDRIVVVSDLHQRYLFIVRLPAQHWLPKSKECQDCCCLNASTLALIFTSKFFTFISHPKTIALILSGNSNHRAFYSAPFGVIERTEIITKGMLLFQSND